MSADTEFAECSFCFDPLPAGAICILRNAQRIRICRHVHHFECMRRDQEFVLRHGGRQQKCPLCNTHYAEVFELPRHDAVAFFRCVTGGRGGRLPSVELKDLLKAMFYLTDKAVDELVDEQWVRVGGQRSGVDSAADFGRLVDMAGTLAEGEATELAPPLLVDDVLAWFDFWAGDVGVLTQPLLIRALIKTLGTGEEERDELRAAVDAVWGLFCGDSETLSRRVFVADDGMADALLAALTGSGPVAAAGVAAAAAAPPGHWACETCTLHNSSIEAACGACGARRPQPPAAGPAAAAAPAAASRPASAAVPPPGPPRCPCGSTALVAGRVPEVAQGVPLRCRQCRRVPPFGAAVWRCQCSAALCVRCLTLDASAARRGMPPPWRSPPLPASVQAAGPVAVPPELLLAAPTLAAVAAPTAAAIGHPVADTSLPRAVREARELHAARPECPHCLRRRPPQDSDGASLRVRARWCMCNSVEETPAVAAAAVQPAVLPAEERRRVVGDHERPCENCGRPLAPEGWVGVSYRRWCQCHGGFGDDLRESLRARQLMRTTGRLSLSGSSSSLPGSSTLLGTRSVVRLPPAVAFDIPFAGRPANSVLHERTLLPETTLRPEDLLQQAMAIAGDDSVE